LNKKEGIEQTNVKWQNIVANKDAEIARLREQLKNNGASARDCP